MTLRGQRALVAGWLPRHRPAIALGIAREGAEVVLGAVVLLAATPESRLATGTSVFSDGGQTI